MSWSELGKTIAGYAPLLGGVVGGPAGASIGSIIASKFGVENKPVDIARAIKHDPEARVKLREIELNNETKLEEIAFKLAEAEMADKQNARQNHKHSKMPATITIMMTILAACYGVALFFLEVPEPNRDMVNYFGGQLIALWFASVVYWTGTTRSSANKDFK